MQAAPLTEESSLEIVETGIPYLDDILGGGLPRGAIVMVVGAPGTGKTTLAQQMAFHAASQGAATLYSPATPRRTPSSWPTAGASGSSRRSTSAR